MLETSHTDGRWWQASRKWQLSHGPHWRQVAQGGGSGITTGPAIGGKRVKMGVKSADTT